MNNGGEVLLIDDSAMDLELAAAAISLLQPPVSYTLRGCPEHALAELSRCCPSQLPCLIFVDWKMAGFGGRDFLQARHSHATLLAVPVVVLTSSSEPRDKALALQLGATAFITKPSSLSGLVELLDQAIRSWAVQPVVAELSAVS